jgi:hypothetical protein
MGLLNAWSFSRWQTYDKCAAQARYKFVEKLPEEEGPALERGKEAHDTLAQYIRGDLPEDNPYHTSTVPGWTYFGSLINDLRGLEPLVEQQWGYATGWKPTGWFGKDTWFRSVLDVAAVYPDGTADVVDFKTGKPRPVDSALQAELYAVSLFRRYPQVRHVTVRFWYVDTAQEGREDVYRFERGMSPEIEARWAKKADKMLSDTIMAPRPGSHCNWCSFSKSKGGPCKYG